METKICTKCCKELPATEEYFHKERKSGQYVLRAQCKKCRSEYFKKRRKNNPEYNKKYYAENKEFIKQYQKMNKEHIIKWRRAYYKKNKDYYNVKQQQYLARKNNLISILTFEQWQIIKEKFNNKCCYCRQETEISQDHFIPVSQGGDYSFNNIVPACQSCNSSKRDKNFYEWYPKQEFYSKERENKILDHTNYDDKKGV